jgi:cytoskeleton protein RodZ
VVLRFEDESWAQVTDAEGRRLVFETGGKGSTKTIQGKPPFRVVLGRPSAVKVEYNGQPFDPMLREKKGIARFDLGAPGQQTGSQQIESQQTGSQQSVPTAGPSTE